MLIYNNNKILIYFGQTQDISSPPKSLGFKKFCEKLLDTLSLQKLVFQKQIHNVTGCFINNNYFQGKRLVLEETEGDFLFTNKKNIGLGILTADCLPIVLYEKKNNVICVIHAGWRGSVNGIVKCAILQMREKYDLDLNSLFVFFGPCAKSCCYSVTQDFIDNLKGLSLPNNVFMERENKIYFDLPACNKFFLLEIGVCEKNISTQYNFCTICDNRFNSVRRNIGTLLRQPTIAVLK